MFEDVASHDHKGVDHTFVVNDLSFAENRTDKLPNFVWFFN
jgi:hypothetical protein